MSAARVSAGILAALLLLECAARVPWGSGLTGRIDEPGRLLRLSAHPEIGLELRPNSDVVFRGKSFRTSSAGLRDRDYPLRKPEGVFRIAGIGDSVMLGWGVGQGEDYLSVLEDALNARAGGRRFEVLNFAVMGYNTVQEYFTLRDRALAYAPDLIILGFTGNDFAGPSFRKPRTRFSSPSAALNWLVLKARLLFGLLPPGEAHSWRTERVREPRPEGFREAFEAIAGESRKAGARVLVVLDSRYQKGGAEPGLRTGEVREGEASLEMELRIGPSGPVLSHREVGELARSLGMDVLDLRELYRDRPPDAGMESDIRVRDEHNRRYIIPGDGHANALWHRRTAGELASRYFFRAE